MQRSIAVRVKGLGYCDLIACAAVLAVAYAPLFAQTQIQEPIQTQTKAQTQVYQATYYLAQSLNQMYLNRVKNYLNVPILGEIQLTSRFGARQDPISGNIKNHHGVDLSSATGTPIIAVASGQVVKAGWHSAYGFNIEIEHTPSWRTRYAHARLLYVISGQYIEAGQFIGQVGSTGRSTGPHLHFEVWRNGEPIDPILVVQGLTLSTNRH